MLRRPPRSTRTDTLFPYTTLFRSAERGGCHGATLEYHRRTHPEERRLPQHQVGHFAHLDGADVLFEPMRNGRANSVFGNITARPVIIGQAVARQGTANLLRSEERRVGKECVSTCRSRWSPYH